MKRVTIGVGGAYSGVGKTTVICEILREFRGWGLIKYTKTPLYSSIIEDIEILSQEGKDTRRYLDSGAGKVVWIQSPYSELCEMIPLAVDMLSQTKGILVEGNSAVEVMKPDIVIFVGDGERERWKPGAQKIMEMADIVIYEKEPPRGRPEAGWFHIKRNKEYSKFLKKLVARVRREA
ncbi:MAG: hypothetical protein AB1442_01885 [Nitrospirota bacterium]